MRTYADSSFLVKLVTEESGSEDAMAEFRRPSFLRLFFLPLHGLEVTNAIRHRAFHLRRSTGSGQRAAIARERDAALKRIERWLRRGWLTEIAADCDEAFLRARALSERHTERLGCRGFDLLHVALALELKCEEFSDSGRRDASKPTTPSTPATCLQLLEPLTSFTPKLHPEAGVLAAK